jgi:hypothetical protein
MTDVGVGGLGNKTDLTNRFSKARGEGTNKSRRGAQTRNKQRVRTEEVNMMRHDKQHFANTGE